MLEKDRKGFNALRIFAIVALCLTVVLWAGLWIASTVPANVSGEHTEAVVDKVNQRFDLNTKFNKQVVTQNIYGKDVTYNGYTGDTMQIVPQYLPENTMDRAVYFKSSDTSVASVDEEGFVTFHKRGEANITVTLKSNKKLKFSVWAVSFGDNPATCGLKISLNKTVKVGTTAIVQINNNKTERSKAKFSSSDESVLKVDKFGYVSGISQGTATLTAALMGVETSLEVTVEPNANYVKPQSIVLKQDMHVTHGLQAKCKSLIAKVLPEGAPDDCIVTVKGGHVSVVYDVLSPSSPGTCTVTFTSRYDQNVKASVQLVVDKIAPTELRVSGPAVVTPNDGAKFTAMHSPKKYEDDVKWEVVSGKGTISKNGTFKSSSFGTSVIRCTSTLNPDLYVEKTIEVKLFADAYTFVRKLMGHAGLSALLGFGIFGTLWLLARHRWNAYVFTAPLALCYAGISELIQHFTPGRFCTMADVITDFLGAMCGAAVACALVAIVCLVWRIASKKSFARLSHHRNVLTFATVFRKFYTQDEYALPIGYDDSVDDAIYVDTALSLAASDVDGREEK